MTMYKRFSVIMFLVLFLSLFISTTMKFHFVVGILWILCTHVLFFCMFRFVSNKKCQPFKNTWHGLRAGEDGGSKNISTTTPNISAIIRIYRPQLQIYQRLLEYIDLPTKIDNNNRRGCANILAHPLLS